MMIVTIDGGAASGKSSTAKALSRQFNLMHVDTGSFYRAVTLHLLKTAPGKREPDADWLRCIRLSTRVEGRQAYMEIDGEVYGEELRSRRVNERVSSVAANPEVRAFLLDYQRKQADVAREHGFSGLVMEGRDIGSVIFPDAPFRFFLDADASTRKLRRAEQGQEDSIETRDRLDTERKNSPLIRPKGAISIDTTSMSLDEVVSYIVDHISRKR